MAAISCRTTAAVAGAAAPCDPAPDEAAGENAPACHAVPTPAATTTTAMPRATQRPRPRGPLVNAADKTSACGPVPRPREAVALAARLSISVPPLPAMGGP